MLCVSVYCSAVSDGSDLCYQPIIPLSFTCHLVVLGLTGECGLNHLISDSVPHCYATNLTYTQPGLTRNKLAWKSHTDVRWPFQIAKSVFIILHVIYWRQNCTDMEILPNAEY